MDQSEKINLLSAKIRDLVESFESMKKEQYHINMEIRQLRSDINILREANDIQVY